MKNLQFSEPITLPYNQYASVVIDTETTKSTSDSPKNTLAINYGLVPSGDDFRVKCKSYPMDSSRNYNILSNNADASTTLTVTCATNRGTKGYDDLFGFTVKTFPHYGVYGFVNYSEGEKSSFYTGIFLTQNRRGGGFFE